MAFSSSEMKQSGIELTWLNGKICKEDKFSARARALAFSSGKQGE
jgi:hypothetical protein